MKVPLNLLSDGLVSLLLESTTGIDNEDAGLPHLDGEPLDAQDFMSANAAKAATELTAGPMPPALTAG